MRRLLRQFRYGEKGFTLIELLVVVAILGILAAIVVPNLTTFLGSGADQAACIELRMVKTAVIAHAAANDGAYPTLITDLETYFEGGSAAIKGNYTIAAGGVVTITEYPGTTNTPPICP